MRAGREWATVSTVGLDLNRCLQTAFDDVVLYDYITGTPSLHPVKFWTNEHRSHSALDDTVAADLTFAGFDEDAARAVVAEVAVLDDKSVANARGATNERAIGNVDISIQCEGVKDGFS